MQADNISIPPENISKANNSQNIPSQIGPFRKQIFSLMNQQETSKLLKISKKFQSRLNTTNSPFKQFSMETDLINQSKITPMDESSHSYDFKSLKQKLRRQNMSNQHNTKSNQSRKSYNSSNQKNLNMKKIITRKKVSFIEGNLESYYKNHQKKKSKTRSKKQNKSYNKNQRLNSSAEKHSSQRNLSGKQSLNMKIKSNQKKNKINQNYHSSSIYLKTQQDQACSDSTFSKNLFNSSNPQLYQNNSDNETQKKNYLLQTLKKMQSVRKNLSKTFQQYDEKLNNQSVTQRVNINNDLQSSGSINTFKKEKRKETNKTNLTSIKGHVENKNMHGSRGGLKESYKEKINRKNIIQQSLDASNKKTPSKSKINIDKKKHDLNRKRDNVLCSPSKFSSSQKKQKSINQKQPIVNSFLLHSLKHSQKWQTLLQNNLISIHFRIVKRKLIQIQLHAEDFLSQLTVELQKGNLKCQSLSEKYQKVKRKEIITLLCSVRDINLEDCNNKRQSNQQMQLQQQLMKIQDAAQIKDKTIRNELLFLPKLIINIKTKIEKEQAAFHKQVQLPYCWIMLIEPPKKEENYKLQSSKKVRIYESTSNRIKTRSTIQNISLCKGKKYPVIQQIFAFLSDQNGKEYNSNCSSFVVNQKSWKKESSKSKILQSGNNNSVKANHSMNLYSPYNKIYSFLFHEQQFKLNVKTNSNSSVNKIKYDLELQGKGEKIMENMLMFLQYLV